jgi:hypothetical protein
MPLEQFVTLPDEEMKEIVVRNITASGLIGNVGNFQVTKPAEWTRIILSVHLTKPNH